MYSGKDQKVTKRQLQGISVRDFAQTVGVTYEAVVKRVKKGKFSAEAFFDDGSMDEAVARVDWFQNSNPSQMRVTASKTLPPKPKSMAEHNAEAEEKRGEFKIKLERAEVALEKERIELANLKKTHMPVDDARRAVRELMRLHRDRVLNFASRHGPALAAELGVPSAQLIGLLEARLREDLNEAADDKLPFET